MPNRQMDVERGGMYAATESPNGELGITWSPTVHSAAIIGPDATTVAVHFALFPQLIRVVR